MTDFQVLRDPNHTPAPWKKTEAIKCFSSCLIKHWSFPCIWFTHYIRLESPVLSLCLHIQIPVALNLYPRKTWNKGVIWEESFAEYFILRVLPWVQTF